MMLTLLLLGIMGSDAHPTGVYGTLIPFQIYHDPGGRIYIADRDDLVVRVFSESGDLLNVFGGKGRGPGEFQSLREIQGDGQYLYCFDRMRYSIHKFTLEGKFKSRIQVPIHALFARDLARKVVGGWVWKTRNDALVLSDESFKNGIAISGVYDEDADHKAMMPDLTKNNPHRDTLLFVTSLDGKKVFYYEPGPQFRIHVYDVTSKERDSFFVNQKPYPYDEDHGRRIMAGYRQNAKKVGRSSKSSTQSFPEFYPMVFMMKMNADSSLRVLDGSAFFKDDYQVFTFDHKGLEIESPLREHQKSFRTFSIRGGWTYEVIMIDDEIHFQQTPWQQQVGR